MSFFKGERPRVVWINIDALRADVFFAALNAGAIPNFSRAFLPGIKGIAASVFPSATMPAQASLATGAFPSHHLITGNAWFDRFGKSPIYRDYSTRDNALHLFGYGMFGGMTVILPNKRGIALGNRDISGATPTLYGAVKARSVRSAVFFNMFSRGCGEWIRPGRMDIINMKLSRDGKRPCHLVDYSVARKVSNFIREIQQLHRLLHIYFPGLDSHSHLHGPASQEEYLIKHLDPCIGMILDALASVKKLENFFFVLTSDHGHSAVSRDPSKVLTFEKTCEILRAAGRECFVPGIGQNPKRTSAVALKHGGALLLYLRNVDTNKWYEQPSLNNDLLNTAKTLTDLSRTSTCGIAPGWLDMIVINSREDNNRFVVKDNKVFAMKNFFSMPENLSKYPDGYRRMLGFFSKRAADMVLMSNYEQGFHFGLPDQLGQHGGLGVEDSMTPMVFSGPGISPGALPSDISILDVAPTISGLYNIPMHAADSRLLPLFSGSGK